MMLLPIIGRELRVRSRGQASYWTRFVVALAAILICVQSLQSTTFGTPSMMGTFVFNGLVGAAFLVSCCACLLTADSISGEWREGTLGLLFLTRVRVVDVLLGKLGSIGITALCALLALLPVLMVPVLAGGITGGEALRKGVGLLAALALALVIGLFCSAAERERFRALRNALFLLCGLVLAPFLAYVGWGRGVLFYAGLTSPLVLLIRAGDLPYTTSPHLYWISLLLVLLVTTLLLISTGWRLRRAVAANCSEGGPSPPPPETQDRKVGLTVWQPIKTESPPVEWLVYRRYGVHASIWSIAVLTLACNSWVPLVRQARGLPTGPFFLAVASPLGTISGLIGAALVGWLASRFFVGVRRSGDLELLLITPVGAKSVAEDQWRVLKRLFVWPVLYMQAPMLPQFLMGLSALRSGSAAGHTGLLFLNLLTVLNAVLGTAAVCWLGLWFGLRSRTQVGAIVWTIGLGKGLPSLLELFCGIVASFNHAGPAPGNQSSLFAWWLPGIVSCLYYLWIAATVRQRLMADLCGREQSFQLLQLKFAG